MTRREALPNCPPTTLLYIRFPNRVILAWVLNTVVIDGNFTVDGVVTIKSSIRLRLSLRIRKDQYKVRIDLRVDEDQSNIEAASLLDKTNISAFTVHNSVTYTHSLHIFGKTCYLPPVFKIQVSNLVPLSPLQPPSPFPSSISTTPAHARITLRQ